MVGSGKVEPDFRFGFDLLIAMELGAVVQGDRLEQGRALPDRFEQRSRCLLLVARVELLDHRVPRASFHKCEDAVPQVRSHHRVALPVPEFLPGLGRRRALADVPLAQQSASGVGAVSPLASSLGQHPQVLPDLPSCSSVATQPPIDRLGADAHLLAVGQPQRDLLRAPAPAHQRLHKSPLLGAVVAASPATSSSGYRVLLRLRGTVSPVVRRGVSPLLSAYRRWVASHLPSNCPVAQPCAQEPRNRVPFTFGELAISHVCTPFLPDRGSTQYGLSPTSLEWVLHLVVESARPNHSLNRTHCGVPAFGL